MLNLCWQMPFSDTKKGSSDMELKERHQTKDKTKKCKLQMIKSIMKMKNFRSKFITTNEKKLVLIFHLHKINLLKT